jgi:hypothetical protein
MVVRLPDVDPFSVTAVVFNVTPATPDVWIVVAKRVSELDVRSRLAAWKLVDVADPDPTWTVPNAEELLIITVPKGVVPPTAAAKLILPPLYNPKVGIVEIVIVKAPLPFKVLLKDTFPLAPAVDPVPPDVFIVEAPPSTTGSLKTRLVPNPPAAPIPFPPLVVRDPLNVIFLFCVSRIIAAAFPPAPDVSAPPPEVLIAPTAMVPEDPVAVSTVFPPVPPAPDTSAVPPDVLIDPIDIVPDVPEVVMVTEPPA